MQRIWTDIGARYTQAAELELDRGSVKNPRAVIEQAIEAMRWTPWPTELPMFSGTAIRAAIQRLELRGPSRVGISQELAPYALYGIETHIGTGNAVVYLLDTGSDLVPVAWDVTPPKAPLAPARESVDFGSLPRCLICRSDGLVFAFTAPVYVFVGEGQITRVVVARDEVEAAGRAWCRRCGEIFRPADAPEIRAWGTWDVGW